MQAYQTCVLIVGAGPTGMTAAMELKGLGIEVRLIDKAPAPATTSRAVGVQARTLELLQMRGLAATLTQKGVHAAAAAVYGGGKQIFRLHFDRLESDFPYLLFVSQAETEAMLRAELARRGVTIEWNVELVALAQGDTRSDPTGQHGVHAALRHPDGTLELLQAKYLIDAEGAHSRVRSTLGLDFAGKSLRESYALGDLYVEGGLSEEDFHIFASDDGFMGIFPLGSRRFRMIAGIDPAKAETAAPPTLEQLQQTFSTRSPIPGHCRDLIWSSWFHINSRMVDRLRAGHVFLGGDSAHIHSPAGAQGMNTGMQDMFNLCWKIAWVERGLARDALLDTYGAERLEVIRHVLSRTEKLTAAIGNTNATFRALFDHIAPLIVGTDFMQQQSATQMSQIGLGYRDSPLSQTQVHAGSLRAGDRLPNPAVTFDPGAGGPGSAKLYERLSSERFTLLTLNGARLAPQIVARVHAAATPPQRLSILGPADGSGDSYGRHFGKDPQLLLVRPDAYVAYIGHADDAASFLGYWEQWFTHQSP